MTSRDLIRGENSAKPGSVIPISPDKEMGGCLRSEIWNQAYTNEPVSQDASSLPTWELRRGHLG
jgi:hypothetical protein